MQVIILGATLGLMTVKFHALRASTLASIVVENDI